MTHRQARSVALTQEQRRRWESLGRLAALALALSYIESLIPIPLPGVKLGLANVPILIALMRRDVPGAFFVGALKVCAMGVLFGNPLLIAYSAAGTLLAFACMAPLSKIHGLHVVLVSMCGAMMHEIGQIAVASVLLGTNLVWFATFPLLVAGCITGALCGFVASAVTSASSPTYRDFPKTDTPSPSTIPNSPQGKDETKPLIDTRLVLLTFIAFSITCIVVTDIIWLAGLSAAAMVSCVAAKARLKTIAATALPTLFILIATGLMQIIQYQYGSVLFTVGPINVTDAALLKSAVIALRLIALICASVATMSIIRTRNATDAIRWLSTPLSKMGINTEGPILAIESAVACLPEFIAAAKAQDWKRGAWKTQVPQLIRNFVAIPKDSTYL